MRAPPGDLSHKRKKNEVRVASAPMEGAYLPIISRQQVIMMDEVIRRIASALQDEGIGRPTAARLARATIASLEEGDVIGRGLVIAKQDSSRADIDDRIDGGYRDVAEAEAAE